MQHDVADDMHAAERRRLRNGPLHRAAGGSDRESFDGAPESACGIVAREAGVRVDVADDVHGIGCRAEPEHLRVEADRDVDVIFAGEKEQCVARCAEFAVLLDGVDLVDLSLDCADGMEGSKTQNVGAEVRLRRRRLSERRCAFAVRAATRAGTDATIATSDATASSSSGSHVIL